MTDMTSRERMLAAISGAGVDHLPFWPKINDAYVAYRKDPVFKSWTLLDFHEYIGSDLHEWAESPVILDEQGESTLVSRPRGDKVTTIFRLPRGELIQTERQSHPDKFPIRSKDDILFMTEWFSGTRYKLSQKALALQSTQLEKLGDKGILALGIGRSPLMHTVELLAGIAETQYMLFDYPNEMEALFDAMHHDLLRRIELMAQYSVADLLYMIEDTSTTLITPGQYRKYCKPYIHEYDKLCQKYGKKIALHMCGHLYDILGDLGDLHIPVFEAFTTPTVGNTHLADGRKFCPETCLIGGTNAAQWLLPPKEICRNIESELAALSNHRRLVITSAGVMPPAAGPAVIRQVCEFVKSYPAKMD